MQNTYLRKFIGPVGVRERVFDEDPTGSEGQTRYGIDLESAFFGVGGGDLFFGEVWCCKESLEMGIS